MRQMLEANFENVRSGVERACARAGRHPAAVKIVAVSKKQSVEKMNHYADYCRENSLPLIFGESYVQEFRDKKKSLQGNYSIHLIGKLQSNKAREAIRQFDLIESLHSEKLAHELNKEAAKEGKKQNVFVQINISNDPQKSGFILTEAEDFILGSMPALTNLTLKGLMTITENYDNLASAREDYRSLEKFRHKIETILGFESGRLALSMGMSHDYEVAIEEGADFIRIGTALFGEREN